MWIWFIIPISSHTKLLTISLTYLVKNPLAIQETGVWSLGWEDTLEKGMATHSNILAWRIPWTEEPGGLQSIGSQRVGHDWSDLAPIQGDTWSSEQQTFLDAPDGFTLTPYPGRPTQPLPSIPYQSQRGSAHRTHCPSGWWPHSGRCPRKPGRDWWEWAGQTPHLENKEEVSITHSTHSELHHDKTVSHFILTTIPSGRN